MPFPEGLKSESQQVPNLLSVTEKGLPNYRQHTNTIIEIICSLFNSAMGGDQ